ncbi:MAG: hypothetical protein PVJ57_00580 [Phycisphaerae bacterium]|jgi:hypothetical protein
MGQLMMHEASPTVANLRDQERSTRTDSVWRSGAAVVLGLAVLFYAAGVVRLCSLPIDVLSGNVIVDDAVYYLVPAEHFLAGHGYAFDGEHRSGGVQPLWAMIAVVLAGLTHDHEFLLRLLGALSAVLWGLAGVLLYRALSCVDRGAALFVSIGWLLTAFVDRLALQGMENGLYGLLLVLIAAYGAAWLAPRESIATRSDLVRGHLVLGTLTALFVLARVEGGVLAVLLGLAVWLSLLSPARAARWRLNWAGAVLFALPGLLLVGGWCVFSKLYFGTFTPISGKVKMFYEDQWGFPFAGGAAEALRWHAGFVGDLATTPVTRWVDALLFRAFGLAVGVPRLQAACAALACFGGLCAVAASAWQWRRSPRFWSPRKTLLALLVLFVIVHFGMFSLLLPHFTRYCTWYFTPEVLLVWSLLGLGVYGVAQVLTAPLRLLGKAREGGLPGRTASLLAGVAAVLLLLVGVKPIWRSGAWAATAAPNTFVTSGRWFNERLPAGQRIGAFSAGLLGFFAPNHRVFNLDGLMNDVEYFEDYLPRGWTEGVQAYLRDKDIKYFADYGGTQGWAEGFQIRTMELLRWWVFPNSPTSLDEAQSYAIWQALPPGATPDPLGPCPSAGNPLERLQFAAAVLHRYPVVGEEELAAALADDAGGNRPRVVTSIVDRGCGRLWHVLMSSAEAAEWRWTAAELDVPIRVERTFGEAVELIGVKIDLPAAPAGGKLVWTLHWRRLAGGELPEGTEVEVRLATSGGDDAIVQWRGPSCYRTYPMHAWPPGEIVVETVSVTLPPDAPRGEHPLLVGVRGPGGEWLTTDDGQSLVFVVNLRVR